MNQKQAKVLRIIVIIFMGLTAAMNILGGIGTVCAAFLTKDYPPMWALYDYQWLYQTLMITTILIGIVGVWGTVKLVYGGSSVYRKAVIILVIGTILAGIQFYASMVLRGEAVPTNIKFYTNALTLIVYLFLRAPNIRDRVDFSKPGDKSDKAAAGGMAAFVSGIVMLTIFEWAGPSHTYMGVNWIDVLKAPLNVGGAILVIGGFVSVIWAVGQIFVLRPESAEMEPISSG